MLIPIIKIKDLPDGAERIVGTNSHDSLVIENNAIHYYNLQCGEGTQGATATEGFSFVGVPENYFGEVCVEMWELSELLEYAIKNAREAGNSEAKLHKLFRKYLKEQAKQRKRLEKTGIRTTSGRLL